MRFCSFRFSALVILHLLHAVYDLSCVCVCVCTRPVLILQKVFFHRSLGLTFFLLMVRRRKKNFTLIGHYLMDPEIVSSSQREKWYFFMIFHFLIPKFSIYIGLFSKIFYYFVILSTNFLFKVISHWNFLKFFIFYFEKRHFIYSSPYFCLLTQKPIKTNLRRQFLSFSIDSWDRIEPFWYKKHQNRISGSEVMPIRVREPILSAHTSLYFPLHGQNSRKVVDKYNFLYCHRIAGIKSYRFDITFVKIGWVV